MLARLEAHRTPLRNNVTLSGVVETFLDPVVVILTLFACALIFGEAIDADYVILSLIAFSLSFPGNTLLSDPLRRVAKDAFLNSMILAGILLLLGYATGYASYFPSDLLFAWFASLPIVLFSSHALARLAIPRLLSLSEAEVSAVVCGCNDIGSQLATHFQSNRFLGVRLKGFFDDRSRERLGAGDHVQLLGALSEVASYVKQHRIDRIYLALPMATQPRILALLDDLKDTTASIYFVPDIFVTDLIQGRTESVAGMPVVAVCETPFSGFNGLIKRVEDIVLSSIILLLIAPILVAVAIGVKRSSPGPVIFKQRRYGLDGKEIMVYKFRSMSVTEDGAKTYTQVTRNDSRVTPFGAFIRKTSLDELPQFINVLQGRMSIVGPRPHAIAVNEQYRSLIPGYMVRHKVKPGITGWAQVNGYRGGDDLEHMKGRIQYDLEYLRHWTITMDIWIIIKTALLVVRDESAY
ncbi:undecaprenyl-phosphate glucose phosphotransferase [Niveibacterium umoris]|uniref:Putative colanic acid biosynthesis UDP-glucose lipid carrier transferase n=1 Tax=Niveibacterium umoris TaxID=1193620 RepID=A0A840BH98_9RHOO|nr:undecaprenyl-phosphate glucose phosphotransferase [Niveibacterium umoris]MBB4011614.1 putative colanic acid biosynthesis UDP-glucose lipid carrier transferase [Niveibacterium umoris]